MKVALIRTHEIQSRQTQDEKEYKNCTRWLQESRELVNEFMRNFEIHEEVIRGQEKMNREGRKEQTIKHEERVAAYQAQIEVMRRVRENAKVAITTRL